MKQKILNVLAILFGLMMLNSGLNKFFHYMPMPEPSPEMMKVLMAYMEIKWIFPLVGAIEVIGGVLFILPRFRALGAIVILPVMVGIIIHHLVHDPAGTGIGLVMLVINIWVIADNFSKYLPMIEPSAEQSRKVKTSIA